MTDAVAPLTSSITAIIYFGDVVFAVSGALTAMRYRMDIIGVVLIGAITGLGGGTIRDIIIDRPVFWAQDPTEIILCIVASVITFFFVSDEILRRRGMIVILSLAVVASSGWFMSRLGGEFFAQDDEARFRITLRAPLGSSIDYVTQKLEQGEATLRGYPEVVHVLSIVGANRSGDVNEAVLNVHLTPKDQRRTSQAEVMARSQADLARIAEVWRGRCLAAALGEGDPSGRLRRWPGVLLGG